MRVQVLAAGEPGCAGLSELLRLPQRIGDALAAAPSDLHPNPPWPAPQQPIDVRDIIYVPPGQLAPRNDIEWMPGWWVPNYAR